MPTLPLKFFSEKSIQCSWSIWGNYCRFPAAIISLAAKENLCQKEAYLNLKAGPVSREGQPGSCPGLQPKGRYGVPVIMVNVVLVH